MTGVQTCALPISIASPVATYQGIQAIRQSGGTSVVVGQDERILAGQRELATAGLYLEASAAISLPAVTELVATGWISGSDLVVCIGTSSGLKDTDATAEILAEVPTIRPNIDDLCMAIGGA